MRILNIGGGGKETPLPPFYDDCEIVRLDLDPRVEPDVQLDIRELATLPGNEYDGVYGSHILEHVAPHDLAKVLNGVLHVLRIGGFAEFRVPDVWAAVQAIARNDGNIYTAMYTSGAGVITARDMIYGYDKHVEKFGDHHCHRNGFTRNTLRYELLRTGFDPIYTTAGNFEVHAVAGKVSIDPEILAKFGIEAQV